MVIQQNFKAEIAKVSKTIVQNYHLRFISFDFTSFVLFCTSKSTAISSKLWERVQPRVKKAISLSKDAFDPRKSFSIQVFRSDCCHLFHWFCYHCILLQNEPIFPVLKIRISSPKIEILEFLLPNWDSKMVKLKFKLITISRKNLFYQL